MVKKILYILLILVMFPFVAADVVIGDATEDFELLTLGVGSRPFGMGGTYIAIADDVNAVYWNPAGLGMLDRREFTGMYSQYFNYEYLAYVQPIENVGTFGLSGYYYQYQEDISDVAVMMSYGRQINDNTSIGITGKYLRKEIYNIDMSTTTHPSYGADIGILYKVSDELFLAGVVQNMSASLFLSTTTIASEPWRGHPLTYKLGAALKLLDGILTFGFDLNLPANDEERFVTIGGEYWVLDWVALRTGYNTRTGQDSGLYFGIGIGNENMHIDWILVPLGLSKKINRISLTLRFGREYRYTMIESNIERHFSRGKRYFYRGEFIKAYNEFKNILELAPGHKGSSDYLARTKVELDEYDTSKEIAGYFERGEKFYRRGDLVKARFEFDSLLIVDPDHKKAKQYLQRIHKRADELIDKQMNMVVKYFERGDYKIARQHVVRVLSFNPRHKKASEYESRIDVKLDKIKKARAEQKEQQEGKWKAISDYYKGLALFNLGQYAESVNTFEDVLKYNPDHEGSKEYLEKAKTKSANMYYNRGLSFFKKEKYNNAIKQFNRSLKYVPDNNMIKGMISEARDSIKIDNKKKAEKYYAQGLGSYTQGDTVDAIRIWKLATKLDPENETIQNALKRAQEEIKIDQDAE